MGLPGGHLPLQYISLTHPQEFNVGGGPLLGAPCVGSPFPSRGIAWCLGSRFGSPSSLSHRCLEGPKWFVRFAAVSVIVAALKCSPYYGLEFTGWVRWPPAPIPPRLCSSASAIGASVTSARGSASNRELPNGHGLCTCKAGVEAAALCNSAE